MTEEGGPGSSPTGAAGWETCWGQSMGLGFVLDVWAMQSWH